MQTYGVLEERLSKVLDSDGEWIAWSNNLVNTYSFARVDFTETIEPVMYPCKVKCEVGRYQGVITLRVSFEYGENIKKQKDPWWKVSGYKQEPPAWYKEAQKRIDSRLRLIKNGREIKVIYSPEEYISTLVDIVMDVDYNNESSWKYQFKKNGVFYDISPSGEIDVLPSKLGINI